MAANEPIRVHLKYLVNMREKAGKKEEEIGLPPGSSLEDLAAWLKANYEIELPNPGIMTVLNGRGWEQHPEKYATLLRDGDKVLLFPPISGG